MHNLHMDCVSSTSCQPTQAPLSADQTVQARDRLLPPHASTEESLQAVRVVLRDLLVTAEQRLADSSLPSCQYTHAVAAAPLTPALTP